MRKLNIYKSFDRNGKIQNENIRHRCDPSTLVEGNIPTEVNPTRYEN